MRPFDNAQDRLRNPGSARKAVAGIPGIATERLPRVLAMTFN